MIVVIVVVMAMTKRSFFSSSIGNYIQADPNHPSVLQQSGPGQPGHPEQASGSEGGETSQHQGPLPLQELEAGACDIKVENIMMKC